MAFDPSDSSALRSLTGDLRQLASVRRLVLDDGPERGVPVLALSTGGGLDFWLLSGRALDIGALWWRGMPIAWQAPQGFAHPHSVRPDDDGGQGFGRMVSGFQATCGLERIRQADDAGPTHGRLGHAPARVLGAAEHWDSPRPELRVEGEVIQYRLGAESLRLRRVVRAPIGGNEIHIEDTVVNDGTALQAHDVLYHFNLGYPAVRTGTTVVSAHGRLMEPLALPDAQCSLEVRCLPAAEHGSSCKVHTPLSPEEALLVDFAWDGRTLPHLQLWANMRPRTGLLAIEPCSSERLPGGRSVPSRPLEPGESRSYALHLRFSTLHTARAW